MRNLIPGVGKARIVANSERLEGSPMKASILPSILEAGWILWSRYRQAARAGRPGPEVLGIARGYYLTDAGSELEPLAPYGPVAVRRPASAPYIDAADSTLVVGNDHRGGRPPIGHLTPEPPASDGRPLTSTEPLP